MDRSRNGRREAPHPTTEGGVEPHAVGLVALPTGIEMEIRSRDLYEDLARKTKDPRAETDMRNLLPGRKTTVRSFKPGMTTPEKTGFSLDIQELSIAIFLSSGSPRKRTYSCSSGSWIGGHSIPVVSKRLFEDILHLTSHKPTSAKILAHQNFATVLSKGRQSTNTSTQVAALGFQGPSWIPKTGADRDSTRPNYHFQEHSKNRAAH